MVLLTNVAQAASKMSDVLFTKLLLPIVYGVISAILLLILSLLKNDIFLPNTLSLLFLNYVKLFNVLGYFTS